MAKSLFTALFSLIVLTAAFVVVRNDAALLPNDVSEKPNRIKNGKASDFDKAVLDEFNLLKNPTTGIIPANAHELELKQAELIVKKQLLDGPQSGTAATSYVLQGPTNFGGRVRSVVFDLNDPTGNTMLAGSVSGALLRSTNMGSNWTRQSPASERFSVTAIAQDPRVGFRNIWYYAGGEALGNSASEAGAFYAGNGVYKSIDNGLTWTRLPNSNTGSLYSFDNRADLISEVVVHPTTGDIYVANLAQIMRSTNGGSTWSAVLGAAGGFNSGMVGDVIVTSTGRLYAGLAGSVGSSFDGVWTSLDGTTWTHLSGTGAAGSPPEWNAFDTYRRIVLAYAPSNENIVYALYHNNFTSSCSGTAAAEAKLFKYDNSFSFWQDLSTTLPNEPGCLNGNDPFAVQGGYDLEIAVKPNDPNTIFVAGTNAYRSIDGGLNWVRIGGYVSAASYGRYSNHHPDVHALKFGPADNNLLFSGSDGGVHVADISQTNPSWVSLNNNLITYQFYHVAIKPETGVNDFIGGAQDNGTSGVLGGGTSFSEYLGGDGVAVGLASGAVPYMQFCGFQSGQMYRRANNLGNGSINAVLTPPGLNSVYRSQFVTYFHLDPDNTENLYYSCQLLSNGAYRIQRITNATTASSSSWSLMDFDYNGEIRSMATTRGTYTAASRLYLGTSTGRIYRMTDPRNAATSEIPDNITPPSFTSGATVIGLSSNPTNHNELMAVYSNYGVVNIWYTNNAGDASPTWINAEGNLTAPSTRSCMIVQNGATTEYYVGTSIGFYKTSSMSGTIAWTQEAINDIGYAPVVSLALRPSDNIFAIGTHGLGMWRGQAGAALPVNLISFDGALVNKNSRLQWRTENESNNKGFELQRSYNGTDFKTIGFIPSAANSSGAGSYGFNDPELAQSLNYYRLKQMDVDGAFKLSNIVLLKVNISNEIKVLNNPFNTFIDIQLSTAFAPSSVMQLLDANGRLITQQILMPNLIRQRMNVRSNLAKGVYYLKVIAGKQQFVSTVVKQ